MAIKAGHSLLVMNISLPAEIAGKFGIYPPSMACCTGLAVILCNEFMALEKPG